LFKHYILIVIVNLSQYIGIQAGNLPLECLVPLSESIDCVTYRVGPLVNLFSLVESLGFDPDPIFRKSGLNPQDFQDPDHRMPYLSSSRLLRNCVEVTGSDQIGFLLGLRSNPSHLGLTGFLIRAAPNVEVALQALVENLSLHEETASVKLNIGSEYSSLSYAIHVPGVSAIEQIYDLSAVMMYHIMRLFCGTDWVASTVKLVRREPKNLTPYLRFFRSALFFNSTECAITFNNYCLKSESSISDSFLYKYLKEEARQLHSLKSREIIEELPYVLRTGLMTGKFSATDIAGVFRLRERTLHRRLRDSGTTFRQELDLARKLVSEQLLGSTSLPVCDVANALGYADTSGFIRAFQRWSNTSPSSWRKLHRSSFQIRS
jgi:AraC-like DNA-binding protein